MSLTMKTTNFRQPSYTQPPIASTRHRNTQTKEPGAVKKRQTIDAESSDHGITEFNQFRSSIAILGTLAVAQFLDYLEWTANDKVNPDNMVMGTHSIKMLANLDVNDPRWMAFKTRGIHFQNELRPKIKAAASQALNSKDLLIRHITGDDEIFRYEELLGWLKANPVTLAMIGKGQPYYEFQIAMKVLNMANNRKMMDYLEWYNDHSKAMPANGRFGTMGIWLLSNLTIDSPLWEKADIHLNQRKLEAINAAKIAMKPSNDMLLFQTHNGDEIYEKDEISQWLALNP